MAEALSPQATYFALRHHLAGAAAGNQTVVAFLLSLAYAHDDLSKIKAFQTNIYIERERWPNLPFSRSSVAETSNLRDAVVLKMLCNSQPNDGTWAAT